MTSILPKHIAPNPYQSRAAITPDDVADLAPLAAIVIGLQQPPRRVIIDQPRAMPPRIAAPAATTPADVVIPTPEQIRAARSPQFDRSRSIAELLAQSSKLETSNAELAARNAKLEVWNADLLAQNTVLAARNAELETEHINLRHAMDLQWSSSPCTPSRQTFTGRQR